MTTIDFNILKSKILDSYATLGNKMLLSERFGIEDNKSFIEYLKELTLYQWILNYWQQYEDGTPVSDVNYITQEEFNNIINRIIFIIQ